MAWQKDFNTLLAEYGLESRLNDLQTLGQEILRWNTIHNITAYNTWPHIAMGLLADSLLLAPHCQGDTCLDIGSGAGFPGLMLGLARPNMQVTLLDARRKRVSFQQHACRLLGLDNVLPIWGRAGEKNDPLAGRKFHTVTCKALASLPVALKLCQGYLRPEGNIILPRGSADLPAAQTLCAAMDGRGHIHEYELLNGKRFVLVIG